MISNCRIEVTEREGEQESKRLLHLNFTWGVERINTMENSLFFNQMLRAEIRWVSVQPA
jgi:hypothetical protein